MRLNQLQYLVALERHGTFSKAAQALYVSQPSISVGIRELEDELGCPLLLRSYKGFSFTDEGKQVLVCAKVILDEIEGIQRIGRKRNELSGNIRIGSTPHFCNSILLDVMLRVEAAWPQVSLLLEEHDSESVIRLIGEGALDVGLVQMCDVDELHLMGRVDRKEIVFEEVFSEALAIVVGEQHPLLQKANVALEEVFEYPYVTFKQAMNRYVAKLLPQGGQVTHINEIVSLRQFLLRTDHFTVIPHRAVLYGNVVYQGKLVALNVSGVRWKSKVGLVRVPGRMKPLERAVLDELEARCKEYQD